MKYRLWSFLCFIFSLQTLLVGQTTIEISGTIIEADSRNPLPYVNVYNTTTENGTMSNEDGYFKINLHNYSDKVEISHIGYKIQFLEIKKDRNTYQILLEPNATLLNEITIKPDDNTYLYKLVSDCIKTKSKLKKESKAYYELKSYINDNQVELTEAYYNVTTEGYKISDMEMKAGRIALRPEEERLFASLESSKAIIRLDLFKKRTSFPVSPLQLSKYRLRKSYNLYLKDILLDANVDSVYVIEYKPKDKSGDFFEGEIWINKTSQHLMKIILNCKDAARTPFRPLFPTDEITQVDFNITQYFEEIENESVFKHIDFIYNIDYRSRIGMSEGREFSVKTKAVLRIYDYEDTFVLPLWGPIEYEIEQLDDFFKINAMPYNAFFWENNDEFRLNDSQNFNEQFFKTYTEFTESSLYRNTARKRIRGNPFVFWSEKRIFFRQMPIDTTYRELDKEPKVSLYRFSGRVFLDVNLYNDSVDILTATIFDPYDSYYKLPIYNSTNCFLNIYFDLCEIERRKFHAFLLENKVTPDDIHTYYEAFLKEFENKTEDYLVSLARGTNEEEMIIRNEIIREKLGIDNLMLFELYQEE